MGVNVFLRAFETYDSRHRLFEDGFEKTETSYLVNCWPGDVAVCDYILQNFPGEHDDEMEAKIPLSRDDVARIIENAPQMASEFLPVLEWLDREEPGVRKFVSYEISY